VSPEPRSGQFDASGDVSCLVLNYVPGPLPQFYGSSLVVAAPPNCVSATLFGCGKSGRLIQDMPRISFTAGLGYTEFVNKATFTADSQIKQILPVYTSKRLVAQVSWLEALGVDLSRTPLFARTLFLNFALVSHFCSFLIPNNQLLCHSTY
jgi:hypothetical protein